MQLMQQCGPFYRRLDERRRRTHRQLTWLDMIVIGLVW
jgi:hypothetical protein